MRQSQRNAQEKPKLDDLIRLESPEQVDKGDPVYELVRFGIGPDHVKLNTYTVEEVERQACTLKRTHGNGRATIKRHFRDLFVMRSTPAVPDSINQPFQTQPFTGLRKLAIVQPTENQNANGKQQGNVKKSNEAKVVEPMAKTQEDFSAWLDMGQRLVADIDHDTDALVKQRQAVVDDLDTVDSTHAAHILELEAQLASARQLRDAEAMLLKQRIEALDHKMVDVNRRRSAIERVLKGATEA